MATFSKLASQNAAIKSLAGVSETTTPIRYIAITEICPRFENKYIANLDKSKSLQSSIKDAGLIEPINVVSIEKYLNYAKHPNEIEYLNEMLAKGIKYFISSGHRRFKAYLSIFMERDVNTDEQWKNLYNEIKVKYEEGKQLASKAFLTGDEYPKEKWLTIPAIVEEKNFDKEIIFYNDSNTTQRELTGFEIIVNTIDELKTTGKWDEEINKIISSRVDDMTDRKVKERINDLIKSDTLDNNVSNYSLVEKRNTLKKLGVEFIPGVSKVIDKFIVNYIADNKKRSVSSQNVMYTRTILEKFDSRLTQLIFDGYLNFKTAKEIISVYDTLDIEKTINDIKNGCFKLESVKKTNKVKYTSRQLLDLIYEIRNGSKTVDEVIDLIEKNEI